MDLFKFNKDDNTIRSFHYRLKGALVLVSQLLLSVMMRSIGYK